MADEFSDDEDPVAQFIKQHDDERSVKAGASAALKNNNDIDDDDSTAVYRVSFMWGFCFVSCFV